MTSGDDVKDADAALVNGEAPPSRHVPLDRGRILDAAISYIDEQGLAGLTMRRLGQALGVEAMALYRYVAGMRADGEVLDRPQDGWQDFVQRLAHGVRRVALTHPKVFPLVASRPPEAPWLRPPLRSLDWVEAFLAGLESEGFSDEAAVASYRAFTSFLLGHLLLEVSTHGADLGPLDVLEEQPQAGLEDYPMVSRLRSQLAQDKAAVEFEEALEELLNRMALVRQEGNDG